MEATVKHSEIIGRIATHCVSLAVTDGNNIHQLQVLVVEMHESTFDDYEYDVPDDSVKWFTEVPADDKIRNEILSIATKRAEDFVRKVQCNL